MIACDQCSRPLPPLPPEIQNLPLTPNPPAAIIQLLPLQRGDPLLTCRTLGSLDLWERSSAPALDLKSKPVGTDLLSKGALSEAGIASVTLPDGTDGTLLDTGRLWVNVLDPSSSIWGYSPGSCYRPPHTPPQTDPPRDSPRPGLRWPKSDSSFGKWSAQSLMGATRDLTNRLSSQIPSLLQPFASRSDGRINGWPYERIASCRNISQSLGPSTST